MVKLYLAYMTRLAQVQQCRRAASHQPAFHSDANKSSVCSYHYRPMKLKLTVFDLVILDAYRFAVFMFLQLPVSAPGSMPQSPTFEPDPGRTSAGSPVSIGKKKLGIMWLANVNFSPEEKPPFLQSGEVLGTVSGPCCNACVAILAWGWRAIHIASSNSWCRVFSMLR